MTRGYPLEIQIRTFAMHQVSEYGFAAHWKYKEVGKNAVAGNAYDQKMSWLRQMVNLQQELADPREYVEALKVDVFADEVFVFTPRGDVIGLPKGSIPLDFAYRIHTEVGHHCVGAKVNGKLVPLEYKLKNGDIVSIITNKANNGPSRDWLNIVASSETRNKIRSWFKKATREENIERGRELIEKEAKRLGYEPKELLKNDRLSQVAKKFNIHAEDDLLASLGFGGVTVNGVLTKLIDLHKQELKENTAPDVSKLLSELKPQQGEVRKSSHGVLVEGEAGILVHLARCCNPIPGDPIVGFVTRGRGVSVHRADCTNIFHDAVDYSRALEVDWDIGLDKDYTVQIVITCNDRSGMLTNLLAVTSEMKVNISSINAKPNRSNKTSTVVMGLEVKNAQQVAQIMTKFRRVKDVYSVSRSMPTATTREPREAEEKEGEE
jgi:GTP pyrophosphokinase